MKLERIVEQLNVLNRPSVTGVEVVGIAYDSRKVKPGTLFVAIPGRHLDGASFIKDALTRGAVAVVGEQEAWDEGQVPYLQVADARETLADVAGLFYGHPSSRLETIGITGTNGKTTVSFMVRALLEAAGHVPGLIGTVRYEIGQRRIPASRTTPEAPDLQAMMQKMEQAGCRSVVMEVSSHALDQYRVRGIDFDVAVFTNLTRDHLDYHGSMERYFAAKQRLFRQLGRGAKRAVAVINVDDAWGAELVRMEGLAAETILTYGTRGDAAVRAEEVVVDQTGSRFVLKTPWGEAPIRLLQLGRFNISNALAAVATGGALGLSFELIVETLQRPLDVPGRLEPVPEAQGIQVFVDYAHTDDALANVLDILREITPGRLLLVFGCGGERDRSKRSVMGAVASERADYVFITSDNPRHEEPEQIVGDILAGVNEASRYRVLLDRKEAIRAALSAAREGDTVLIAGKGHENYQDFGHTVVPFDDVDVARKMLIERMNASGSE